MTTGPVVVIAVLVLLLGTGVLIVWARQRRLLARRRLAAAGTPFQTTPDAWTEGETTQLLTSMDLDRLYTPKIEYVAKPDQTLHLLLRAAVPQHFVFPRPRLGDLIQVKIGPQGMERLRLFRKAAAVPVSFVVCDRNWQIVAAVDIRDSGVVPDERQRRLETIKERCLKAAHLRYVVVDGQNLPRYQQLRQMLLGDVEDEVLASETLSQ